MQSSFRDWSLASHWRWFSTSTGTYWDPATKGHTRLTWPVRGPLEGFSASNSSFQHYSLAMGRDGVPHRFVHHGDATSLPPDRAGSLLGTALIAARWCRRSSSKVGGTSANGRSGKCADTRAFPGEAPAPSGCDVQTSVAD
jgi:hypothetical protein